MNNKSQGGKKSVKPTSEKKRTPAQCSSASSGGKPADPETCRRGAVVLQVLAGVRTPAQAAEALKISVNYYYILERKAVQGLVEACRPVPRGPGRPSAETQILRLKRDLEQCRNECQRQSALVRVTERAIGVRARPSPKKGTAGRAKNRRRRKPVVRALQAATTLDKNSTLENGAPQIEPTLTDTSTRCDSPDQKESSHGTMRQEATGRSGS